MFSHRISRRAKASAIVAMAAAGVLALGSQGPGSADAAVDPFVPYAALTNPELAELRGGFRFRGHFFHIGVDVKLESFVNGVGLISFLNLDDEGGIGSSSTTFFPGPDPDDGQTVVVTEDGAETTVVTETTTIVHELTPTVFKSIIETSGNSQNITNTAQFDISISATLQAALDSFSQNILTSSIGLQIGLSSLF